MAIATRLSAIGILALSLAVGFFSFYLYSDHLTKEQKKKQLEEFTSQLINFVIFIWLGKIILNLPHFLSYPLSILAYPSDSDAFYFAVAIITIWLIYKSKRKNLHVLPLLESFMHIFLITSFIYEFIQFVVNDRTYAFGYLILLAILIGIFFFLRERLSITVLLIVIVTVWSLGMITLGLTQAYVTVFGYIMEPWFVTVLFATSMIGLTNKLRKRDT